MARYLPELPFLPTNAAGTYGESIDGLLHLVTYIITPWTILTFGLILLFCIVYRRRQDRSGQYVDSHETLFTVKGIPIPRTAIVEVPTLMVLGLDLWIFFSSVMVWGDIKIDRPETATTVQVVGKQFGWDFYYAGPNEKLNTTIERQIKRARINGVDRSKREVNVEDGDDVRMGGLVIPAGKKVGLKITSKDVIHSLFIPNLRFKQDAVPGRNIDAWLIATKPTRPTYLESQILEELEGALAAAKEQFSGEESEKHIRNMQEQVKAFRSQCDVTGSVPDYASLEGTQFTTFQESANALIGDGDGSGQIQQHLKTARGLFQDIQSNEQPYFSRDAYTIGCAELCGSGHSGMVAELRVLPEGFPEETYKKLQDGELNYGQYFLQ